MHGPAAEALLEGAEYDAETEDMAGASEAAEAAGVRPPRPSNRSATTKKQKKNWHDGAHPTRRFTFGPHGTRGSMTKTQRRNWVKKAKGKLR